MLLAGAGAGYPVYLIGAFTFSVYGLPSDTWWNVGSAKKFMLIAGACANDTPALGVLLCLLWTLLRCGCPCSAVPLIY